MCVCICYVSKIHEDFWGVIPSLSLCILPKFYCLNVISKKVSSKKDLQKQFWYHRFTIRAYFLKTFHDISMQ